MLINYVILDTLRGIISRASQASKSQPDISRPGAHCNVSLLLMSVERKGLRKGPVSYYILTTKKSSNSNRSIIELS